MIFDYINIIMIVTIFMQIIFWTVLFSFLSCNKMPKMPETICLEEY